MNTLRKKVTQDDMSLYSGPGNIHSDIEVARRTGLDAPIAQGMQTLAFASELMTKVAGPAWIERGQISVKFTKPVFSGDEVSVEAVPSQDGSSYEVKATNQNGDLLMLGTARLR